MMKKRLLTLMVMILLLLSSMQGIVFGDGGEGKEELMFKDVPRTHWAYDYVAEAVEKGIVKGFPNGTFKPNDPVTVAQFLQMMFLSMAEKDENGKLYWAKAQLALVPEFAIGIVTDYNVKFEQGNPWYINFVNSAKWMGVIREYEYEGRYNENLTRVNAAYMINIFDDYFHGPIHDGYADIAGPQLFKDINRVEGLAPKREMAKVALRGIMIGNNGYFNPMATITRAEAVKIVALLPDESKRSNVSVNLKGVPYSNVTSPGYGKQIYVFINAEMKDVYDTLRAAQPLYKGATDEDHAQLTYFENEEKKAGSFHQKYWVDLMDMKNYTDLVISFSGNNYTIGLGTEPGYAERGKKPLYQLIDLLYKDSAPVKKLIDDAVKNVRNEDFVDVRKTFERRDILIYANPNQKEVSISIGAYGDK